jgi:hypothetical protein
MVERRWQSEQHHSQWMYHILSEQTNVARTKSGKRKLRLFACGCCRLLWDVLTDSRLRHAVEVAERFAEGEATRKELETAREVVVRLEGRIILSDATAVRDCATSMVGQATLGTASHAAFGVLCFPQALEENKVCGLLRCVFSNLVIPVTMKSSWRDWNGALVRKLAQSIYDERNFAALPILADALEEAGCANADILAHCGEGGVHSRGCWVLDLILSKDR